VGRSVAPPLSRAAQPLTRRAVGVLLSTKQNPSQPSDFNTTASGGIQQTVVPFTKQNGQGLWCIPIEITSLGIAGVTDGANVTIEIAFSGPDGTLFQVCAPGSVRASAGC
jgi:hypothetical protein